MLLPHKTTFIHESGFTLIELIIVVAIIAILAAIAIPNFMRIQLKSKTSEVKHHISAILKCELVRKIETNGYVSVAPTPIHFTSAKTQWILVPPANPGPNGGAGSFEDIGYRPSGNVYYMYAVSTGPNSTGAVNQEATIDGTTDLDGDGTLGLFASALANRAPVLPGPQSGVLVPITTGSIENLAPGNY